MRKKSWLTVICCLLLVCLLPSLAMAKNKTKAPARDWKLTVAQQKLELLGYDVDRKDGRISKDTTEAIKKFQKEHGLKKSGKPFRIRIPVIPGVNDSDENFEQTALRLTDAPALEQVELLPYHVTAGAKYAMVGRQYRPEFDTAAAPNLNTGIFLAHGIACTHL